MGVAHRWTGTHAWAPWTRWTCCTRLACCLLAVRGSATCVDRDCHRDLNLVNLNLVRTSTIQPGHVSRVSVSVAYLSFSPLRDIPLGTAVGSTPATPIPSPLPDSQLTAQPVLDRRSPALLTRAGRRPLFTVGSSCNPLPRHSAPRSPYILVVPAPPPEPPHPSPPLLPVSSPAQQLSRPRKRGCWTTPPGARAGRGGSCFRIGPGGWWARYKMLGGIGRASGKRTVRVRRGAW